MSNRECLGFFLKVPTSAISRHESVQIVRLYKLDKEEVLVSALPRTYWVYEDEHHTCYVTIDETHPAHTGFNIYNLGSLGEALNAE